MAVQGLRRSHTKARNSCYTCRKRHVKCSLQGPICANCIRRGDRCSYSSNLEANTIVSKIPSKASSTILSDSPFEDLLDLTSIPRMSFPFLRHIVNEESRHLMYHYLTQTKYSLDFDDIGSFTWSYSACSEAHRHPFLMYGLLSISALHLYHLHKQVDPEYLVTSQRHFIQASRAFQRQTITDHSNLTALFPFIILVIIIHFGGSLKSHRPSESMLLEALEPFIALRSVVKLTSTLDACRLNEKIERARQIAKTHAPSQPPFELDNLERWLTSNPTPESKLKEYQNAIALMRTCYRDFGATPTTWISLAWWPGMCSNEFVELIQQKDTVALVIFRFWCLRMQFIARKWYWNGWVSQAVQCIDDYLNTVLPKEPPATTDQCCLPMAH